MNDVSDHPPQLRPRRFRFSLLGLFFLTLGIAGGIGVARLIRWDVMEGICAAIVIWLVLGLGQQIRDLWRVRQGAPQTAEALMGLCWALAWRIAAIAGALACVACRWWGYASLTEDAPLDLLNPDIPRRFSEILLVVTLLATIDFYDGPRQTRPSAVSRLIGVGAMLAASGAVVILVCSQFLIPVLVHVAIHGVELSQPYRMQGAVIYGQVADQELQAEWLEQGFIATLMLMVSLALMWGLAKQWRAGLRARLAVGMLLAGALLVLSFELAWAAVYALPRLSPFLLKALPIWQWPAALPAGIGLAAFASAAAWKLSVDECPTGSVPLVWRPYGRQYCHEFVLLWLLPFSTLLVSYAWSAWQMPQTRWGGKIIALLMDVTSAIAADSRALLWLALFLAGMFAFTRWWLGRGEPWPAAVKPLPTAKFITLWVALFWTTLLAVPTLAWLATVVWLLPMPRM